MWLLALRYCGSNGSAHRFYNVLVLLRLGIPLAKVLYGVFSHVMKHSLLLCFKVFVMVMFDFFCQFQIIEDFLVKFWYVELCHESLWLVNADEFSYFVFC